MPDSAKRRAGASMANRTHGLYTLETASAKRYIRALALALTHVEKQLRLTNSAASEEKEEQD